MADDKILEDLKKLSPAERIKKLKELQEKNKKEIEKAQDMIRKSEEEEVISEELEKMPIPQLKAVDIDQLFSSEEKSLFREKHFVREIRREAAAEKPAQKNKESELEELARKAPALSREQERVNLEYINRLSRAPAQELRERVADIYSSVKDTGYMSRQQEEELRSIDYATRKKMHDIETGKYTEVSKEVADSMVATEKIKNWLQSTYKT